MSVRALLRLQRRAHQLALRGLGVVLAVVALWVFLSLGMLRSLLDAVFNRADLQILLSLSLTLLLLLIPISGIYSLLSQYAYWEGWLDGLPQLEPTPGPRNRPMRQTCGASWCISTVFIRWSGTIHRV